jgi:hypothetical protein
LLTVPEQVVPHIVEYEKPENLKTDIATREKQLETRKERLSRRGERLIELYLGEAVGKSFFDKERRRVGDELVIADQELSKLRGLKAARDQKDDVVTTIRGLYNRVKGKLAAASDEIKREVLQLFVKRVIVHGNDLHLEVYLPNPNEFAGQHMNVLSRKEPLIITLKARLLSVGDARRFATSAKSPLNLLKPHSR